MGGHGCGCDRGRNAWIQAVLFWTQLGFVRDRGYLKKGIGKCHVDVGGLDFDLLAELLFVHVIETDTTKTASAKIGALVCGM